MGVEYYIYQTFSMLVLLSCFFSFLFNFFVIRNSSHGEVGEEEIRKCNDVKNKCLYPLTQRTHNSRRLKIEQKPYMNQNINTTWQLGV